VKVVSLVPSATETLRALGVDPVACTRFCEQPDLPTIGGTKDPHVEEIVAFAPDLVVVNDEENRVEDADALRAEGMELHSMSPRALADVGPAMVALAQAVDVDAPAPFAAWSEWLDEYPVPVARHSVAVLVWRRPWMTMNGDTYGSSLLAQLGLENAFAAEASRYPEVGLEEIAGRGVNLVLLPSEPYPFADRHVPAVQAELSTAMVELVDGRDLFWWGIRTPEAFARLRRSLTGPFT
jgi:ABC-type Fe3+-hydroxamate transport system substrate-binding protein